VRPSINSLKYLKPNRRQSQPGIVYTGLGRKLKDRRVNELERLATIPQPLTTNTKNTHTYKSDLLFGDLDTRSLEGFISTLLPCYKRKTQDVEDNPTVVRVTRCDSLLRETRCRGN